MPYPTKQQRYAELMHNKKTEYHGRYTAFEFALAKKELVDEYEGELSVHKADDICRYVAKNDWPKERVEVYTRATQHAPELALVLTYYDTAQEIFDRIHHGLGFVRTWEDLPEEIFKICESQGIQPRLLGDEYK